MGRDCPGSCRPCSCLFLPVGRGWDQDTGLPDLRRLFCTPIEHHTSWYGCGITLMLGVSLPLSMLWAFPAL